MPLSTRCCTLTKPLVRIRLLGSCIWQGEAWVGGGGVGQGGMQWTGKRDGRMASKTARNTACQAHSVQLGADQTAQS